MEILRLEPTIPILELIPQRPPFVLVDEFFFDDEEHNHAFFTVRTGHVLVEEGAMTEGGLVENMAQTAAARVGYICRREGTPVPVGYIGAVQDLEIKSYPREGATLRTTIAVKHQVFNVTQVRGTVWQDDEVVAACDLKIFVVT